MENKIFEDTITDPIDPELLPESGKFDSAKALLASLNKYDPDQPRDERGRFGSGNGSTETATSDRKGMGDIPLTASKIADMQGGSAEQHIVDGKFTEERQALHDEIINKVLEGIIPPDGKPELHILGGGPAAGKSSAVEAGAFDLPGENIAMINADEIKEMIPEVEAMQAAKDPGWAAFGHEESSYLAARTLEATYERGINAILDGTGDSSVDKITGKIQAAKDAGYSVNGSYITVPTEMAVERAMSRAESSGRYVPESVIRDTHAGVSEVFPQIIDQFDSVKLVDSSDGYRLVGQGGNGNWTVADQTLWEQFLGKAGK
jgi:predicted ABC-type ATPase